MPRGRKRAGLYARTSKAGAHVDAQLNQLRRVADQRGWSTTEYVDDAVSSTRKRPELARMMAAAAAGELDLVVVVAADRLARSTSELLSLLEHLRRAGVEFVSLREGFDTSGALGTALMTVVAAIAQFERDLCAERSRAGLAAAKARGMKLGRPRRPVDLTAAQELVRGGWSIRDAAAELGVPYATLHRRLAELGTRGPKTPAGPVPTFGPRSPKRGRR